MSNAASAIMSNSAILWTCLIVIVLCVVVNYKWKVNLGFMTMAFAFLIGCLGQGQSAATVFGYWPDNLLFFLIAAALFYGYARENGTLIAFGSKILWKFRKQVKAIPWVVFFIGMIMGILGAGPGTIVFLTPIAFVIGEECGMDPMLSALAVDMGYGGGTMNPWTGSGVVLLGLVEKSGIPEGTALRMYGMSFLTLVVKDLIFMAIFFVYYSYIKKKRGLQAEQPLEAMKEKPAPFTPVQVKTFVLILVSFFLIVVPNSLNAFGLMKGNTFLVNLVSLCKPQAILVIFAVLANIFKLADTKKVITNIPMNTVLMIAGVCFLMAIATNAGLLKVVTNAFKNSALPAFMVAPLLALVAAFMAIFSSATSVVCPLLFPMVPGVASALSLNPIVLYSAILVGSDAASISPFSTAGANIVAMAPDEKLREKLIPEQTVMAIVVMVMCAVAGLLGLYNMFAF